MLNNWTGAGRLVKDPETRNLPNGNPVANFTIAVDRDYKPKDGERETDFIDIISFRQAEFVSKYMQKGSMVIVNGRLQIRNWKDNDGNYHSKSEIVADNVYFGGSKSDNNSSPSNASTSNAKTSKPKPAAKPTYTPEEDSEDEDSLPF